MMKYIALIALAFALTACDTVVRDPNAREVDPEAAAEDISYNEAQQAYQKANAKMHSGMGVIDEDADVAFIQGMIPHHQGAVDMANIILEHGDDEEAQKLARDIIVAQEKEIAWMENWLKERGLEPLPEDSSAAHHAAGH